MALHLASDVHLILQASKEPVSPDHEQNNPGQKQQSSLSACAHTQRRTRASSTNLCNRNQDAKGLCTPKQPVRRLEAGLAIAHLVAATNHYPCALICRERDIKTRRCGHRKCRVRHFLVCTGPCLTRKRRRARRLVEGLARAVLPPHHTAGLSQMVSHLNPSG